tara:strand:- start:1430 stop:2131 length:702 start_codon:yes stop_codon:yes gene_type:complete
MLKTVAISGAKKTLGISVTYRAGKANKYETCPAGCELNCSGVGALKVDQSYLDALLAAVPRRGVAFTYTHFPFSEWLAKSNRKSGRQTVINFSAKTPALAAAASRVVPAVVVMRPTDWRNGKHTIAEGVRIIRCPAEYKKQLSCADCGGGVPLCARQDRTYVIGFTAHGAAKRSAADPAIQAGCYANGGRVALHWTATAKSTQDETDGEKLIRFARGLPPRAILRHHVAGDLG